jgi:hypothetical protein
MFKKIIYSVFGIVCVFGLIQVALQYFYPKEKSQDQLTEIDYKSVQWKTYTNKGLRYSVSYPDYLKFSETKYSTVFVPRNNNSGSEEFPHLYISIIPDSYKNTNEIYNYMSLDSINKIFLINNGESIEVQSWPYAEYSTFMKLATIRVLGADAVVVENRNVLKGDGRVNRRILLRNGSNTILIGSYYKSQEELDVLRSFLESFRMQLGLPSGTAEIPSRDR